MENALAVAAEKPKEDRSAIEFRLSGNAVIADYSGVLYWPAQSTLVVSDLHLEKGSSFARRGMMVPPYDTGLTLDALSAAVDRYEPQTIISLGDSFHDGEGAARLPDHYKQALLRIIANRNWVWVSGNHDPQAPADLPGDCVFELKIENLTFRHEPSQTYARGEVAGHLHPAGKIKQRSKNVRRPCFITDTERLIMPAFGAYTGGLNVHHKAFKGLFDETRKIALLMGKERIYGIAGKNLVG